MKLDSLDAQYVSNTADTVTFRFKCHARLESPDEAEESWGLEVNWSAIGMKLIRAGSRRVPAPQVKNGSDVLTPGQKPEGLDMGENWEPSFEHKFPKSTIVVEFNDQYIFSARLIPLVMPSSNYRTDVVVQDVK